MLIFFVLFMKMCDIPLDNRPRERLVRCGVNVLSDAELLAVVLKCGCKDLNVVDMCNMLLSLDISSCSFSELQSVKGVGVAKACQILALFEFYKRISISKVYGKVITCSKDVFDYCSPKLSSADKEHFMILHLDTRNRIIKDEIVSVGTLNSSLIHPREVFKSAIKANANSIILVHNHPSGDPEPSNVDILITKRLLFACKVVGITVHEHIIIGDNRYFSFADQGHINRMNLECEGNL